MTGDLAPLSASERPLEDERSDYPRRVWQALTEMYGSAFTAAYGEIPPTLWVDEIMSLSGEQIADGLRRLRRQKRSYPPNLTEFSDACRPQTPGPRYLGRPTTMAQDRQLRGPRANPAHVRKCIENMRTLLAPPREPGEDG